MSLGQLSTRLLLGAALPSIVFAAGAANAQQATPVMAAAATQAANAADAKPDVSEVLVVARNRAENVQDVPIPVSVFSGAALDKLNATGIKDISQQTPNVLINAPNARQTSIAIRGLGRNTANDALEPSVGVIVDDVVAGNVGMSWVNYVDLEQVELLRGPQGTLLGKNTTLGVLNITTRGPSFQRETTGEISYGERNAVQFNGSTTGPLIDDTLAFRVSGWVDDRDGFLKNQFHPNQTFLGSGKWGVRGQLLWRSGGFETRFSVDHTETNELINVNPSLVDPATFANGAPRSPNFTSRLARDWFGGYVPVIGSFSQVDLNSAQPLKTQQNGVSARLKWSLGDYTLTSITAYRRFDFDAKNDTDLTRFDIMNYNGTLVRQQQVSQEIRLASPTGRKLDWQVGVFAFDSDTSTQSRNFYGSDAGAFYASGAQYANLNATATGRQALRDALGGVFVGVLEKPSTLSLAAYGQADWRLTDKATLTFGLRDTWEKKDSEGTRSILGGANLAAIYTGSVLTDAQAIRVGRTMTAYGPVDGQDIQDSAISWLVSPSYKLTRSVMIYASAAQGEKSGAVQFNQVTGAPQNVRPEKVTDFELGVKSELFDRKLRLNLDAYWTEVRDYQAQLTALINPTTTQTYLGNVSKVRMRGVELEGAWKITPEVTASFGGAYNDAIYVSFANSPCPLELSNVQMVCDLSGRQISGAPKFTGNLGLDFDHPLTDRLSLYGYVTDAWRSEANMSTSLSAYGVQKPYHVTNLGLGVRIDNGRYEVGVWAKNLLDTLYVTNVVDGSGSGADTFTPGERRLVAAVFKARF